LSERDYQEAYRATTTNYLSVVSQLLPLSKILQAQGRGHIAVISSVAGLRGRPRNYTYGAAKAALTTYLQGLRSRLYPFVRITTVLLGPVDTPMTTDHEKNGLFLESPDAARRIVRAIDGGKKDVVVPGIFRAILLVVRLLPEGLFQRIPAISGR
jgi:short-subunit dehydrogenase